MQWIFLDNFYYQAISKNGYYQNENIYLILDMVDSAADGWCPSQAMNPQETC